MATASVDITVLADGSAGQGSVTVEFLFPGESGPNALQQLLIYSSGGTYILSFLGVATAPLAWNASAATIQTALNGLASISGYASATVANTLDGGAGVNAQQTVVVVATGGTFTLTYSGDTTSAIAWNASDAAIQAALEALAAIGPGDVSVSSRIVTFVGDLAATPVPLITANGASLTGSGSVTVTAQAVPAGASGNYLVTFGGGLLAGQTVPALEVNVSALTYSPFAANEQVLVAVNADGGTFTLTLGANTTTPLAENATTGTVETALRALASVGAGNVNVTGYTGGPYTLEFVSGKASTNMGTITADASSLTLSGTTTPPVAGANPAFAFFTGE